jgi:photosynthetic reaction center cytochrome c subunit
MHSARAALVAVLGLLLGLLAACERTPTEQRGLRGLGMVNVGSGHAQASKADINAVPQAMRRVSATGPTAGDEYANVQVLGDLSKPEFARLMLSFKTWIAPEEGCNYCHNVPDYASDSKAPKLVARAMIRMTREINKAWAPHVKATGVTCYTCHRGLPIPPHVWFSSPEHARGNMAVRPDRHPPTPSAARSLGLTDAMGDFLLEDTTIRVTSTAPLKAGNHSGIRDARATFALMTVMSESLGVNCTFCHNSRAYGAWDESPPQRLTAWHGIRMTRELNTKHLAGLSGLLQPAQRGPAGDGPKVFCGTCHAGLNRPLNGVNMVKDFPELIGTKAELAAAPPPAAMVGAAPPAGSVALSQRP